MSWSTIQPRLCAWYPLEHMEHSEVIRHRQHGFTNSILYLIGLVAFCDGVTTLVDEGRATDVVYLDFSKAFDIVPQNMPSAKLDR